jgi:hypothetical protein
VLRGKSEHKMEEVAESYRRNHNEELHNIKEDMCRECSMHEREIITHKILVGKSELENWEKYGLTPVAWFCKQCNEVSVFIKGEEFLC